MNIKIYMHLMPWELDDANNVFNKIAIANKYLSPDDQLTVDTCLNLSSYIIDWDKSIIPKEFYIKIYEWIITTDLPNNISGRFLEWTWHIFWYIYPNYIK